MFYYWHFCTGLTKYLNLNITVAAKTPAGVGPASPPVFVNRTHHDSKL